MFNPTGRQVSMLNFFSILRRICRQSFCGNDATFVSITNSGFGGDGDKIVEDALGSKGGFTCVLAGLKAYLEHGIKLNLIEDVYPKELKQL